MCCFVEGCMDTHWCNTVRNRAEQIGEVANMVKSKYSVTVSYISGYLMPRSYAKSLYALQAIRMLSVPPDVTWTKGHIVMSPPGLAHCQHMLCYDSLCHRSWVHRGKACKPFAQPPPPSFSHQERCLGEGDCSMRSLHIPVNTQKGKSDKTSVETFKGMNTSTKSN